MSRSQRLGRASNANNGAGPEYKSNGQRSLSVQAIRQFIYDNYDKAHGIFSDETESAWERRFQLIETLVISITCHVKMANNPISGQYIGV